MSFTPTIDFSRRMGHACCISRVEDGGQRLRLYGWDHVGEPLRDGAFVIVSHAEDRSRTTRYRLERVQRMYDGTQMWFADAVFAPREEAAP